MEVRQLPGQLGFLKHVRFIWKKKKLPGTWKFNGNGTAMVGQVEMGRTPLESLWI